MSAKKRVLIVEDDQEIRNSFTTIVNSSPSFQVINAYGSCEDAIKHIAADRPDYVLMDIELPGINGIKGTKIIKDKHPHVEIVMVTVYEDSDLVSEALKAGASGYIIKSANYMELLAALDEISRGGAPMSSKLRDWWLTTSTSIPTHHSRSAKRKSFNLSQKENLHTDIGRVVHIKRNFQNTHQKHLRQTASELQSEALTCHLPWKNWI